MHRKNPADDVLINSYTEGQDDLLGNARTSPTGITLLHFNNGTNQIRTWAFRSGFRSVFWRKQQPVFSINQRAMEINRVDGFTTTADRTSRLGRTSRAHTSAISRSDPRRFGARRRERFKISNWCLSRTDSARTDRTPPGRARRIEVARTWTNRRIRSRIPNVTRKSQEADSGRNY